MEGYLDSLVRDLNNLANDALEKVEKTKAKPKNNSNSILLRASGVRVDNAGLLKSLKEMDNRQENNNVYQLAESTTANAPIAVRNLSSYDPLGDPAPDVTQPHPEIPNPVTPVPNIPSPEIEQPAPDYPGQVPSPEIEKPIPDIQPIQPDRPEIQPPLTEPSRNAARQTAGSFFDQIG